MDNTSASWYGGCCDIRHCLERAEVWYDGKLVCWNHLELWMERIQAIAIYPALRETLELLPFR